MGKKKGQKGSSTGVDKNSAFQQNVNSTMIKAVTEYCEKLITEKTDNFQREVGAWLLPLNRELITLKEYVQFKDVISEEQWEKMVLISADTAGGFEETDVIERGYRAYLDAKVIHKDEAQEQVNKFMVDHCNFGQSRYHKLLDEGIIGLKVGDSKIIEISDELKYDVTVTHISKSDKILEKIAADDKAKAHNELLKEAKVTSQAVVDAKEAVNETA